MKAVPLGDRPCRLASCAINKSKQSEGSKFGRDREPRLGAAKEEVWAELIFTTA